ncbi:MAG: type II toxin-antitoxin system HicB family antitoxin [bacterium]|nr:type II toxin-antitoxin system HicB family antitoxin [bacterium]
MDKKITKIDKEKIKDLRSKFSARISVKISRSEDGGFVAQILSFPGCLTQGDTLSELVEMVNDCVKTYLNVPQKFFQYMPTYLPPVSVAHQLDAFPAPKRSREVEMKISSYEGVGN